MTIKLATEETDHLDGTVIRDSESIRRANGSGRQFQVRQCMRMEPWTVPGSSSYSGDYGIRAKVNTAKHLKFWGEAKINLKF